MKHVRVMTAVSNTIEGCDPVVAAHHCLPVDDTGLRAQLSHCLDDEREAIGENIARSAVEPHALARLASNDPEAVVLDFVQPDGAGGRWR